LAESRYTKTIILIVVNFRFRPRAGLHGKVLNSAFGPLFALVAASLAPLIVHVNG
jgi:hypothetical protein